MKFLIKKHLKSKIKINEENSNVNYLTDAITGEVFEHRLTYSNIEEIHALYKYLKQLFGSNRNDFMLTFNAIDKYLHKKSWVSSANELIDKWNFPIYNLFLNIENGLYTDDFLRRLFKIYNDEFGHVIRKYTNESEHEEVKKSIYNMLDNIKLSSSAVRYLFNVILTSFAEYDQYNLKIDSSYEYLMPKEDIHTLNELTKKLKRLGPQSFNEIRDALIKKFNYHIDDHRLKYYSANYDYKFNLMLDELNDCFINFKKSEIIEILNKWIMPLILNENGNNYPIELYKTYSKEKAEKIYYLMLELSYRLYSVEDYLSDSDRLNIWHKIKDAISYELKKYNKDDLYGWTQINDEEEIIWGQVVKVLGTGEISKEKLNKEFLIPLLLDKKNSYQTRLKPYQDDNGVRPVLGKLEDLCLSIINYTGDKEKLYKNIYETHLFPKQKAIGSIINSKRSKSNRTQDEQVDLMYKRAYYYLTNKQINLIRLSIKDIADGVPKEEYTAKYWDKIKADEKVLNWFIEFNNITNPKILTKLYNRFTELLEKK